MIIAIDLGATNIKGCLMENGKIISNVIANPTNTQYKLEGIVNSLKQTIDSLYNKEVKSICISSAGDVDVNTKTLTYVTDNLPGMTGFNFDAFTKSLYHLEAFAINDGLAALLGEVEVALSDCEKNKKILMLTFGTGIGCATYENGVLSQKKYGHLTLVEDGIKCTCGKLGCAEAYLSASSITKEIENKGYNKESFFKDYLNKAPGIYEYFSEYLKNLKIFLTMIKKDFDYDFVIFGGGLTNWMGESFNEIFSPLNMPIKAATLKNDAGLIGAYYNMIKQTRGESND